VPDMFVPVTLGMDVDLFLALAVLDAQFVVAATPRGAECLEDGAGLVGGQLVRHLVFEVVQAACDEWLVGIAFEEGDQDFHPHTRYGDATVSTACPTAGYPQPATGAVIVLAMPVPVELDADAAIPITMDLLAMGSRHPRGLAAADGPLRMAQRRAIDRTPGRCDEGIAVALREIRIVIIGRGDGLFQHLGLFPLVDQFGQQPQIVLVRARMAGERQEVTTDQPGDIASALCHMQVGAMTLHGPATQVPGTAAIREAAWIVVVPQFVRCLVLVSRLHEHTR